MTPDSQGQLENLDRVIHGGVYGQARAKTSQKLCRSNKDRKTDSN